MSPAAKAPEKPKTSALKVAVKPFTGELPKRKGPSGPRTPTPYDDIVRSLCEGDKDEEGKSPAFLAEAAYKDPTELKPITNDLRKALKFVDPEGKYGLQTWVVENGIVFRIGPKIVREKRDKEKDSKQAA